MKIRELIAILDRREMGRFFRDRKGRVSFVYDEKWQNAADAYPPPSRCPSHSVSTGIQKPTRFYGDWLSQLVVTACHSNLSQLVIVTADSIWWGPWGQFQPR